MPSGHDPTLEALRERAEELDHYFTHSTELLAIFDMKGRARRLNSQWERLLGVPLAELEGHSAFTYVHQDDVAAMQQALLALSTGAGRTEGNTRALTAEGGWRRLEWSATRQGERIYLVAHDVTERFQAQQDLAMAHATYEGILSSITEAVYIQDGQGRFLAVNRAVEEMYGYPREAFLGRTPEFLAAPGRNDMAAAMEKIGLAFAGQPQQLEFWGLSASGREFPKEVSLTSGMWFGQPVLIAVARDISERFAAEQALAGSEEHLRVQEAVLRDITELLSTRGGAYQENVEAITALTGRLLKGDVAMYNRLEDNQLHTVGRWQVPVEIPEYLDPLGRPCTDIILGKVGDVLFVKELETSSYATPGSDVLLFGLKTYLGHIVCTPDGERVGTLCLFFQHHHTPTDLDYQVLKLLARSLESEEARRSSEEALRLSEQRFHLMFDTHNAVMLLLDPADGAIVDANSAAALFYGYRRAELCRMRIFDIDTHEPGEIIRAMHQAGVRQENRFVFQHGLKDGSTRWVEIHASPIRSGTRALLFSIIQDITERRNAEEALRRSESFMRAVLDSSPLGISVRSGEGRLMSCNEAWRRIWAIPDMVVRDDMQRPRQGLKLDEQDDYIRPWWDEILRIYREGGRLTIPEVRTQGRRPGSAEWISQDFYAIPDDQGSVDRIVVITQDISERKHAEDALRLSQSRLASAVEMAHLGHWEYDVEADLFTFNDQFYKVLHTTTEEVGGLTMSLADYQSRFLHPEESHTVEMEDRLARMADSSDYTHQVEQRVRFADGDDGWISVRTYLQKDRAGRTTRTYGIIQDITERRRVEERLRETGRMVEEAQRLAKLGSYSLDVQSGLWQSSTILDGIFGIHEGYTRDVAGWAAIIHPEEREAMVTYFLRDVLEADGEFDRQYRIVRLDDGETRWVHGRGVLGRGPDGQVVRMVGTIQDITERVQAEEALRRSEAHYRQFFEHDLTADYISTADGRLLDCNPAYVRLFGFESREQALQTNTTVLYPDAGARHAFLRQLNEKRHLEYQEVELRDLEGQPITVIMNVLGEFDGEDKLSRMQGYLFDITKHKQLQQQFYQAQKMESIGRLAGGVAHDFNNLLTVINGHVDLMRAQVLPQDPLREHLDEVAGAGERAARLTRQLLAFSRRQVLQLEPVALNLIVNDLNKMLQRLIGEDIRLDTRLEKTLPAVMADAGQLEQVVVNLAVNSRDAMLEGGTLAISTQDVNVDAEFCRQHPPMTPGRYCLMEVSDTGSGMSLEVQSRVFEPFFTTKEKGKGTGLGLATVYGIVKQVGGYIWVTSEPGLGTTFQIFLPAVQAPAARHDPRSISNLLLKGSETVLVVEDEEMVRRLAVRMLTGQGYRVLEARNGREALALLETTPEVRLVLTDVIMPVMGGRELAESLQALPAPPEIIFMSGYTEDAVTRQGILQAGLHFIQKPFDLVTLLQRVRAILDGK